MTILFEKNLPLHFCEYKNKKKQALFYIIINYLIKHEFINQLIIEHKNKKNLDKYYSLCYIFRFTYIITL